MSVISVNQKLATELGLNYDRESGIVAGFYNGRAASSQASTTVTTSHSSCRTICAKLSSRFRTAQAKCRRRKS